MNGRTTVAVVLMSLLGAGRAAAEPAARLQPYKVSEDLREVQNRKQLLVGAEQRALLHKNLFLVSPTEEKQLFFIYENNDYGNLPSFVTTDLALQLFHVFYDFTLRKIETEKLHPLAQQLTRAMLKQSQTTWQELGSAAPEWREAALRNLRYFGVAARLLGDKPNLPPEAEPAVARELALMEKHEGFLVGAVFPYRLDYSQFVPRGHYTRTETLRRYFKVMLWYGLAPFALQKQVPPPPGRTVRSPETVRSGQLLARDLRRAKQQETWQRLYEPTAFFVGTADDLTPGEYLKLMDRLYGGDAALEALQRPGKLDAFIGEALKLRAPAIQFRLRHVLGGLLPIADPRTPQLRLMAQRELVDSEAMQRLTDPRQRYFPAGLDVMAVLGSKRARHLLDQAHPDLYKTRAWAGYRPERETIAGELAKLTEKEWTRTLYLGWLWALQAQLQPAAEGWPSFARSAAWDDRSLSTALASWAELRHDTILYAKQSLTAAECGGDEEEKRRPRGYVEPNLELYRRLIAVVKLAKEGLVARRLITPTLKDRFERFTDLLTFLHRTSQKELLGQKLSAQDYEQIRIIGATVENLTLSLMQEGASRWDEIRSPTDKDMALVADVHTGGEGKLYALEEAVGAAQEILVVVPIEGKLQLNRGAVFSYYEFLQPIEQRLTDEAWQKRLQQKQAPPLPPWTKSYLFAPARPGKTMKVLKYSSGC